jgi:hypothetical protein
MFFTFPDDARWNGMLIFLQVRNIELIVEPTFEEFKREPTSRRAFLTCVAIFHVIDRVV